MRIVKPLTTTMDPHNRYTSRLHFRNGVVRDFYMRGAIAFPNGKKEGFAVMAGVDLETGFIIIFEQFRYWTISHWLNDDGTIHEREDGGYYLGLIQFITDNLSLYQCGSYYWGGQHIDVWTRHATALYDIAPSRLELIEVPYVALNGLDLLHAKIKTHGFRADTDSVLDQSITQFVNMQTTNADYDNAALCLMILLSGFEFQPWMKTN
uniref:Uncharacterized protein n=1 Tax=viral metagenome TaxID=1070528 RepID=A0A6M3IYM9_9ZZZZ